MSTLDRLSRCLQLESIEAVLGHLRRGTPGELRLASNGKRVDEELEIAVQQVGQRQHLLRLQSALAIFDVRDRLTVVQAQALGELILRPALGLARRFDAVADQLLRDLFEHGSHLLNLHSSLAKLKGQEYLALCRLHVIPITLRCHPLRGIELTILDGCNSSEPS